MGLPHQLPDDMDSASSDLSAIIENLSTTGNANRHAHGGPSRQENRSHGVHEAVTPKFWGVTVKGWAITALSTLGLVSAMATKTIALVQDLNMHKKSDAKIQEELVPVANATKEKLTEAEKHASSGEKPTDIPIHDSQTEIVSAKFYASDGCVKLSRTHNSGGAYGISDNQDLWIPDPSRNGVHAASERLKEIEPLDQQFKWKGGDVIEVSTVSPYSGRLPVSHVRQAKLKLAGYQGSCLNPHPGVFQVQNNQVNACEVQVFRQFADGCRHWQLYNACTGQWAPGVNWLFCSMQHHL
jgi:hypothetical protein